MADGGSITTTGLEELRRAVQTLPVAVTARLKAVAEASAARMQKRAQARLRAQLKTSAHALIDAITVTSDLPNKQVHVISNPPKGQHGGLPLFVEYGTVRMAARPYMRPAADQETPHYRHDLEAAAVDVVQKVLA
jgi:HK97 gp10 family phage protein